ncbi:MAG TPA: LLM class F420-dependent oxidoreductase [Dehalococcoidia bacterium]|nr:LLM class F420-dependent oxidoreductase [Dehalococcoidia bacterium]
MKFGITMFPADFAMDPVELGRAVEERGFESLWFPEHTHIPTSRKSPWPGGPELPREYYHTHDPFVALAAVAATTTSLKLGTGICLVVERDPITTAKEVASLDLLSNGRFLFGIGGGWNLEEMENHGTDPDRRWKLMRERVLAMKEIWANDEAEFHGKHVDFDPIWSWPKPVQKPHPPIYVGGGGPHTFQRVVDYGDAWLPILARVQGSVKDRIDELNRMAAEKGRGPIPVTAFGARPDPATFEEYEAAGIERCVLWLPPAPADEVMPVLDRHAELMNKVAV